MAALEVAGERGPHGQSLGLLALRVVKEGRSRAGLVRHGGLGVVEFLPHDDDRKCEEHGVDDAHGREFEPGDLVVLGQLGDADPPVDQGLRAHSQNGGKRHDQRDQKPQREARQEIGHSDLRAIYARLAPPVTRCGELRQARFQGRRRAGSRRASRVGADRR